MLVQVQHAERDKDLKCPNLLFTGFDSEHQRCIWASTSNAISTPTSYSHTNNIYMSTRAVPKLDLQRSSPAFSFTLKCKTC